MILTKLWHNDGTTYNIGHGGESHNCPVCARCGCQCRSFYDVFPVKGFSLSLFLKLEPLEHFLDTFFLTFFVTCLGFVEGEWNTSSGPISLLCSCMKYGIYYLLSIILFLPCLVKSVNLSEWSDHVDHFLVIFALSWEKSLKRFKSFNLDFSNLEQHLPLESDQLVFPRSQEKSSTLVRDKSIK